MGRSKSSPPKRRRIDDEAKEQEAIHLLLTLPPETVEEAAAEATRIDVEASSTSWIPLDSLEMERVVTDRKSSTGDDSSTNNNHLPTTFSTNLHPSLLLLLPPSMAGLGLCTLSSTDFAILTQLHKRIKDTAQGKWTSWSGNPTDPRRRAFGFLPGTLGYSKEIRTTYLDLSTPWQSSEANDQERPSNERAMVILPDHQSRKKNSKCNYENDDDIVNNNTDLPMEDIRDAVNRLCDALRPFVTDDASRNVLRFDMLIAAQPNLHCGRHLLPSHVDHPRKDGFGICIVTIAMVGHANILLQSLVQDKRTLRVQQGQAYIMSGPVRNQCSHGVLADVEYPHRESLNLRFGLHDYGGGYSPNEGMAKVDLVVPSKLVLQHWEDPTY